MTGYLNTDRIMSVITGHYISDDSKEKEKERNKERERDREERARERERESVKDRLKIDMVENETRMDG